MDDLFGPWEKKVATRIGWVLLGFFIWLAAMTTYDTLVLAPQRIHEQTNNVNLKVEDKK